MTTNCLNTAVPIKPEMRVTQGGHKYWTINCRFHRENGPAIEYANGSKHWYLHGQLHREDGPAVEWAEGSKEWYLHDQRHREDGPAIEYANGDKWWFLQGKEYTFSKWKREVAAMKKKTASVSSSKSESTQPVIEVDKYGTKRWKLDGRHHREDGPAKEWADGGKEWWVHGKFHREDGPAIEDADGYKAWYLQGKEYSEADWQKEVSAMKKKAESTSASIPKVESTQPVMEVDEVGTKRWKLNGQYHREDGPAIEFANGGKKWFLHDNLHREDGPAIECANGDKYWYLHGQLHREVGPAIKHTNGLRYWYLQGKEYSEADWQKEVNKIKKNPTPKVDSTQPVMYDPKFLNNKLHREDEPVAAQSTSVSDHLKSDVSHGTFRVAAKTIPKTARTALLAFLKAKKVKKNWLLSLEEMMSTEWGLAFIQQALAWSFRSLPQLKEDPRATALADEWAIDSVAVMGNEVIQELTALLAPMMTQVMELPTSQIRIQAIDAEVMEMEESSQQPRAYV